MGYANAKLYKCTKCPPPQCFAAFNSKKEDKAKCKICDSSLFLLRHVSFVDSPGHSDLQETALSGASTVDFSLLLVAANCQEDPETNEHYKANKILGLSDKTFIIHNKIDLIDREQAYEHYDKLKQNYSNYINCGKIKIYKQEHNVGALKNKIFACTKATNEWICLMDSDNYCDEIYIEALYDFWKNKYYLANHIN